MNAHANGLHEAEARAARIVGKLLPMITAELVIAPQPATPKREMTRPDQLILDACQIVGAAVDRLEAVKFTAAEPTARLSLEKAARRLRTLIRKREARHAL